MNKRKITVTIDDHNPGWEQTSVRDATYLLHGFPENSCWLESMGCTIACAMIKAVDDTHLLELLAHVVEVVSDHLESKCDAVMAEAASQILYPEPEKESS